MKEGKPSFTAEGVCALRAAESILPEDKRVCYDPYAKEFISLKFRLLARSRFLTRLAIWCVEKMVPGMAGYIVGRTRYLDDYLKSRIKDGIEQLVIMGAGYDSRAYRIDELKEGKTRVFEVDFPATQKAKKLKVEKIMGSLPDYVVYVPVDFDKGKLDEGLFEGGYDKNLKTLFIWEGVTPYITPEAMDGTLAFVANNAGKDSSIIFDYMLRSALDGTYARKQVHRIRRVWEMIAEPLTSERFCYGIEEGTIEEFLAQRGFDQVVNQSGGSFQSAYFKGANENGKTFCVVYAKIKS
jgi:methyltransferase (TIGR00027 family)